MQYPELSVPANTTIFEPNTKGLVPLKKKDLISHLTQSPILDTLYDEPVLIVINDHHRSTPSYRILEAISEIVGDHSIGGIIIASGTHEPPDSDQHLQLLMDMDERLGVELFFHSARTSEMYELGVTSRGTPVILNKLLLHYNKVLCINSVEPHFFAGYTGGIKSLVPGLAAQETVERNHSWALDENSGPTLLDRNPIQLDLWEAGEMIEVEKYGIQLVSVGDEIYNVFSGTLQDAFRKAVEKSSEIFCTTITEKFDLILSIVDQPLDRSLYQAQKGLENTRAGLMDQGEIVLLAKCHEGIGNTAFYETIVGYSSPQEVIQSISREIYKFGDHKVYKFATLASKAKLYLVSELTEKQTSDVFAKKLDQEELQHLLDHQTPDSKIAVVLDAGTMVLKINDSD